MPSTGLRRRKRLLERTSAYNDRTNEPTLWLAVLLVASPTLTNMTKIKRTNDNKNEAIDLQETDSSIDIQQAHYLINDSNSSTSGNVNKNKQTTNESYLNGEDSSQIVEENESILNSKAPSIKVNNTKYKNTNKNDNKDVPSVPSTNDRSKASNNEDIRKQEASATVEDHNTSASNFDQDNKRTNNEQEEVEVDGKLDLLQENNDNASKEDKKQINTSEGSKATNNESNKIKVESREIIDAIDFGMKALEELVIVKEPLWYKQGLFLDKNHPASKVATFGAPTTKKAILLTRFGYATLEASKKIAQSYPNVSRHSAGIPDGLQSRIDIDACPLKGKPICPPASKRFRTSDGTCNNMGHPWWGAAMLPMERFLPPVYEDGIQSIRRSVFGDPLPSPRRISTVFHRDRNRETPSVTMMFTQWGQFLDHDITSTVKVTSFNGSIPRCCEDGGRGMLPPDLLHPSCLPIEVPKNDPFLSRFGIRCMEFLRSAPSTRINCELGWREQISQVTPYIDASTIYGSDVAVSDSIRTFRDGLIIYGRPQNQGPLNPPDPPEGELCKAGALSEDCLQPGDTRMSETPGLTAMHTVFVRYHNKVATVLAKINPHWSDERLFQETRKIVYSVIQHITYEEYLPIVGGLDFYALTDLEGHNNKYDKNINPTIVNSFGAAAFRFGHSMVQNSIIRTDSNHEPLPNNVSLHEEISNFNNIWTFGSIDRLLLGFSNQPSQRRDEFMAKELTNHLFQFSDAIPFGMDLAAINIQRGRDHGIPPYTAWRKACFLWPIESWKDLEGHMSISAVIRLKTLYRHVDDIDLFTGGLAEKPVSGGVVGETFACIIANQFSNIRRGDRFFYTNKGFESSLTPAQLQQIKRVSLAQIICQTTDEVDTIQPFIFLAADKNRNNRVPCDSPEIGIFDLAAWTEKSLKSNGISDNLHSFEQRRSPNDKLDFNRRRRLISRPNQTTETKTTKNARNNKRTNRKHKSLDNFIQVSLQLRNISPNLAEHKRNPRNTNNVDMTTDETDNLVKSKRRTKRTTKKPYKRRPTTLKPFHITSLPMEVKYINKPKKPAFTELTFAKPTTNKPHYYQLQDQTYDDVTYLLGIIPKQTTKAPPPLQVNINIHYSQHSTATPNPVEPSKKKKHPQVIASPDPSTNDYTARPPLTGTHKPTYGQNNVILITKRPGTSTKRPADDSYPVFIYNPSNDNPNNVYAVTTKHPTYLVDGYVMTTKKTKHPNINGYNTPTDVFHRPIKVKPGPGYYADNDYDDNRYIPIETKPSTTYQGGGTHTNNAYTGGYDTRPVDILTSGYGSGQYSNRPGTFENKPFSSSKKPLTVISSGYNSDRYTTEKPSSYYYSDDDNDSDIFVITNNKRRPQTTGYNRDETYFNDHIFNAFFNRRYSTDKKNNGNSYPDAKPDVDLDVDGKLDFKSRVVYKKTDKDNADTGRFVEMSSVTEEDDIKIKRINTSNNKLKREQRRSVNKIRIVDAHVTPGESRNRWKSFNVTK